MDNFNFQGNNKAVNCQIILSYLLHKEGEPILSESVDNYINNLLTEDDKVACMHFLRRHVDHLCIDLVLPSL